MICLVCKAGNARTGQHCIKSPCRYSIIAYPSSLSSTCRLSFLAEKSRERTQVWRGRTSCFPCGAARTASGKTTWCADAGCRLSIAVYLPFHSPLRAVVLFACPEGTVKDEIEGGIAPSLRPVHSAQAHALAHWERSNKKDESRAATCRLALCLHPYQSVQPGGEALSSSLLLLLVISARSRCVARRLCPDVEKGDDSIIRHFQRKEESYQDMRTCRKRPVNERGNWNARWVHLSVEGHGKEISFSLPGCSPDICQRRAMGQRTGRQTTHQGAASYGLPSLV